MDTIHVGTRVRHLDGYAGTVRYAGPLHHLMKPGPKVSAAASVASDAFWYGVEWDEDGHGKNDGSVQGHQYFSCPEGRGSLVKGERLKPACSLFKALTLRYTEEHPMLANGDIDVKMVGRYRTHGADPFVRDSLTGAFFNVKQTDCQANFDLSCVGFTEELPPTDTAPPPSWTVWNPRENRHQYHVAASIVANAPLGQVAVAPLGNSPQKLRRVSDVCDELAVLADDGALEALKQELLPQQAIKGSLALWFPNITVLVLKGTLISAWGSVRSVLEQLPTLVSLNVSDTRLGRMTQADALIGGGDGTWSHNLTMLSAANVGADRTTLSILLGVLPHLTEVNFSRNDLVSESSDDFHSTWNSGADERLVALRRNAYRVAWQQLARLHLEGTGLHLLSTLERWLFALRSAGITEGDNGSVCASTALCHLNLSENAMQSLEILASWAAGTVAEPSPSVTASIFANVSSLWMRGAHFPTWDDLALKLLVAFPGLQDIIFSDDALLELAVPQETHPHHHHRKRSSAFEDGMPEYGSQFNQTTLERFRYMVAVLPKQIQRLNNSTITDREVAAAERFALHLYLKGFVDFLEDTAANPEGRFPTPAEIDAPTNMHAVVAAFVREQRERGANDPQVFHPKPRFKRDDYTVHVVLVNLSFEDMCQHRLNKGFEGIVAEHLNAANRSTPSLNVDAIRGHEVGARHAAAPAPPLQVDGNSAASSSSSTRKDPRKSVIDVRWTVQSLRNHLLDHIGLADSVVDPLMNFAHEEDHWTAAEQALIALTIPAHTDEALDRRKKLLARLPVPLPRLFPPGSVLMFHYDMELAANDGAKDKGLHCKHLVRPADKLYEHRIADGDAVVLVSLV